MRSISSIQELFDVVKALPVNSFIPCSLTLMSQGAENVISAVSIRNVNVTNAVQARGLSDFDTSYGFKNYSIVKDNYDIAVGWLALI